MEKMIGRIHSYESCGTVDGPGVRFVVFMQGCPMRCLYCHNPDTWVIQGGKEITIDSILKEYEKKREFYDRNGGITLTGGEPLVQIRFVIALFKACKERHIHTCLDTSGIMFTPDDTSLYDELLQYTDLVMLDIKHIDPQQHMILTKQKNDRILAFCEYMEEKHQEFWIRHVVVPGITQNDEYLYRLGRYLGKFRYIKALDTLPYHTMGVSKYEGLGIEYPLKGVKALTKEDAMNARKIILKGMKDTRREEKR